MTQGSHLLLYLQLEYLKGVQRVGKGAVLELRLQSCIYKQCTHKLLRVIFKKVLVSVFTPITDDTRVENVRLRLAFQESRTCMLEERSQRTCCLLPSQ